MRKKNISMIWFTLFS